jgi:predicted transposase YdaD
VDVEHPHDTFFRSYFSEPGIIDGFLRFCLAPETQELLDFESLAVEPGTYIDSELREHYSDIAVSASLGGSPAKVYILVEHKSYYDPAALLQILRYMVETWRRESKSRPQKPLTPIIPILFYHGPPRSVADEFGELFGADYPNALSEHRPDFSVRLINLTEMGDEELDGPPEVSAGLWALKYARTQLDRALEALNRLTETYGEVFARNPAFGQLTVYLSSATTLSAEEVLDRVREIIHNAFLKERIMSAADELIAKGRAQGIAEGREEGREEGLRDAARRLLSQGFPAEKVAALLGLPQEVVEDLR